MKIVNLLLSLSLLLASANCLAQPYATWSGTELKLSNGLVERTIQLPTADKQRFSTTAYKPTVGPFQYFTNSATDFSFELAGKTYSGRSGWRLKKTEAFSDTNGGNGASVILLSTDGKAELAVQFLLYPSSPVVRKNLVIKNLSGGTAVLQSVDVEKLEVPGYFATTFSWVCHDYGRRRSIGPYDGNMQDALVIVHNSDWQQGVVVGNEAAGVVKHTSVFWNDETISSGLTHKEARYPFRKYIKSGESFTTPQVFTIVYNNHKDPDEVLNTSVADYVRKYLGTRLSSLEQKPTFVYNTWTPFQKNINEQLIMGLAKSAADAGMKEFVIDDGWQENYGDWVIDKAKFPNGLKPVFEYIKSLGMKPGIWVSVGSASTSSNVFKAHPEWFVQDDKGRAANLHMDDATMKTACFGTGWYGYIKEVLRKLSVDYGLEYMKLDFTVVTSPYRFTKNETGCYAATHPGHTDHHESLYANYEQVWKLFDELHAAKPDLFIDCTFETMGGLQLIDYAMLKHAEGNWLSNFNGPEAKVDLRIRNMAWWRSPAVPATALVIGNPEMQDTAWALHVKSLAGALPIMLGDPRKLSAPEFIKYRGFADWLQAVETRHGIMNFRQDLPGFSEPQEGGWDGFQRINTDTKSGGIIGVFRHGSKESKRLVTINYLTPTKLYTVKDMDGKLILIATGEVLSQTGFEVTLAKLYDGELFEVSAVK